MSRKVLTGEGKRFRVVWDWYQPQMDSTKLYDGDEVLLYIGDSGNQIEIKHLLRICDLLNELGLE